MSDRLNAAQAALNGGRRDEAVEHLIAAVTEDPARTAQVYRILATQLYSQGRWADGEAFARQGLERHPRDYDLLNIHGVMLRKLKRQPEALAVLERAVRLDPKNPAAQQNFGNVLLDLNEAARAETVFTKLVRAAPRSSEFQRQLGRALLKQGKIDPGLSRLRQAVAVKRDNVDAWLDMVGTLNEEFRTAEALETLDKAIAANPDVDRLVEAKALVLRRSGDAAGAEAFLLARLEERPDAAWIAYQLGAHYGDRDRARSTAYLEQAHKLEPSRLDYAVGLIESLERDRAGDEGGNIDRAYELALGLLPRRLEFTDAANKIVSEVFLRVADFDAMDAVGDFRTLGRGWAQNGRHTAFLKMLGRVSGEADRLELLEQHRIWGRAVEAAAARRPIKRPPPRAPDGKIRLGFMSSDLRLHPVGYFAMPLFDHLDAERFDVFVYSYSAMPEDAAQRYFASKTKAYNVWPAIGLGDAAERIAADQLDILIELGGSTHMNRLDVMAYRPAPLQASWLGYPHSAGLEAIDYLICDPYNRPTRPDYLIETPLEMPNTWIALGDKFFSDQNRINDELPSDRNGYVTYGTANNPHKYNRATLRAWARVVAATPGAKFQFVRPEAGGPGFRRNIEAVFAEEGVTADRLVWQAVRGMHLPLYNEIDITLDPFPLTGGTTTTESLWMGVPLVTLVGETFYERLSYSILCNAGLADLCASNLDEYQAIALRLAADADRRRALRKTIRDDLRASPLGQTRQFAQDFYDMIHGVVTARRG